MNKNIFIKINSTQINYFDDENGEKKEESDTIELCANGKIIKSGRNIAIRYKETELTGMENTITRISFNEDDPEKVTLSRSGAVNMTMFFEHGQRYSCAYDCGVFPINLSVVTQKLFNSLTYNDISDDKKLEIEYIIEMQSIITEKTILQLHISELNG